jgi:hypothetical protein
MVPMKAPLESLFRELERPPYIRCLRAGYNCSNGLMAETMVSQPLIVSDLYDRTQPFIFLANTTAHNSKFIYGDGQYFQQAQIGYLKLIKYNFWLVGWDSSALSANEILLLVGRTKDVLYNTISRSSISTFEDA